MSASWKIPVEPTVSREYCEAVLTQNHHKPHAFDTTFRYSSVMSCSRSLSYDAAGLEPTDPMDGPSLAIAAQGSLLHEEVQNAYLKKYPDAETEARSQIKDLISGSADIFDGSEVVEIKTVGGYKFDLSVLGAPRYSRNKGNPKGPSLSHICQGALNAHALGAESVRIVYISREALSVVVAERLHFSSIERFAAEWLIPKDVWEPMAVAEIKRLRLIQGAVLNGKTTPRIWADDDGKEKLIEPENTVYPCRYCDHYTRCIEDGPGVVPITKEATA